MIKVIGNAEFNDYPFYHYVLNLENGDQIIIKEEDYNTIMIHESVNGNKYEAIVNEHEDDYSAAIEYIGFELI